MTIDIEQQNDLCVLHCKGRFTAGLDLEYIHSKMDEVKKLNCRRVLVDFREVSAIGSMGVAFIVGLYTSAVRGSKGFECSTVVDLWFHPCWLESPHTGSFHSTAYVDPS